MKRRASTRAVLGLCSSSILFLAAFSGTLPGIFSGALPLTPSSAAAAATHEIDVVSFNVLAPMWAAPVHYPEVSDTRVLDATTRRARLSQYLRTQRAAELVCLQEVTASEYPHLAAALGSDYVGAMSRNDRDYWSNWLVPEIPWEPNGTAIFVRRDAFRGVRIADHALGTGNHALLATATHRSSGQSLRAWSVHLDSDRTKSRTIEIERALALTPARADSLDVMCGDINEDTVLGTASGRLKRAGFADVLAEVGVRVSTHPWTSSYNKSKRWAIIDHVLVRNGTAVRGSVFDAGVRGIVDEPARITEYLRRMGSDHYVVHATVEPQ